MTPIRLVPRRARTNRWAFPARVPPADAALVELMVEHGRRVTRGIVVREVARRRASRLSDD